MEYKLVVLSNELLAAAVVVGSDIITVAIRLLVRKHRDLSFSSQLSDLDLH